MGRVLKWLPRSYAEAKKQASILAALADLGWNRSARLGAPVDARGEPLPWFTYAAILWLDGRIGSDDDVLELGGGHSTLWFAARARRVTTVEADRGWADEIARRAPSNVRVLHRPTTGDRARAPRSDPFVQALDDVPPAPDIVIVDGPARVTCVEVLAPRLPASSIVVLDNSGRPDYGRALDVLAENGYGRIDFLGPTPGSGRLGITSLFCRGWSDPRTRRAPPLPDIGY